MNWETKTVHSPEWGGYYVQIRKPGEQEIIRQTEVHDTKEEAKAEAHNWMQAHPLD